MRMLAKTRLVAPAGAMLIVAFGIGLSGGPQSSTPDGRPPRALSIEPHTFRAIDGTEVDAELGTMWVPENRDRPDSRIIPLSFVRFASTSQTPGPPIVYLAGGPGGSGIETARGARFPLFMRLRAAGDVIAFDQRGTGFSSAVPACDSGSSYPLDLPLTGLAATEFVRAALRSCLAFWQAAGVDLGGYNTWQSAADLDQLRAQLGVERVALWGISYGSHLGLATMKRFPSRISRAVLASIEDLDETVKLPALTDAYFRRVQEAIDRNGGMRGERLDVVSLMRRVHARLDERPQTVEVRTNSGVPASLTFGQFDIQMLASGFIADPRGLDRLIGLYQAVENGVTSEVGQLIYDRVRGAFGRHHYGMSIAMDLASGISPARRELVAEQAPHALLGDVLNFPMPHLAEAGLVPDLGEDFRAPTMSAVPTLFLSGTLDGRTYMESAAVTAGRFERGVHVIVENAGHNLFMTSPEVGDVVLQFLEGRDAAPARIVVPTQLLVP